MRKVSKFQTIRMGLFSSLLAAILLAAMSSFAADVHTSTSFKGIKVNGGTASHSKDEDKNVLTLSDDFKVPDTPDPHWQVVDSKGNVYLLQRLDIKGGKVNRGYCIVWTNGIIIHYANPPSPHNGGGNLRVQTGT
ncbi:MAG: hypothetical protein HYW01_06700 [Deltaproteobacteria bacterium]|nr:hypothetical protein [Deltaproteobacteria bacterium]